MPLPAVVGGNLARLRHSALTLHPEGITQEHVAAAARRLGLAWNQSTVAELERGHRGLTAAELVALPHILDEAIRVAMPGAEISFGVGLDALLGPPPGMSLAVTDALLLTGAQVHSWLGETTLEVTDRKITEALVGSAERKAARTLGRSLDEVVHASLLLWRGRNLTQERERRLQEADPDPDPRSRQRQRGHITRSLLHELRDHFDQEG
jgi:hypothetical protein